MSPTTWIQTASASKMDLINPDPTAVRIEDIALALSRQPRFNGHGKFNYSVAQHSVLCATQVPLRLRIHALLHDAHEAYTGDISAPVKSFCSDIVIVEDRLQRTIYEALELEWPSEHDWEIIYDVDKSILYPEYHALFDKYLWDIKTWHFRYNLAHVEIERMSQEDAFHTFMIYYQSLYSRKDVSYA